MQIYSFYLTLIYIFYKKTKNSPQKISLKTVSIDISDVSELGYYLVLYLLRYNQTKWARTSFLIERNTRNYTVMVWCILGGRHLW